MPLPIFVRLSLGYLILVLLVLFIGLFSTYQLDTVKVTTSMMIKNDTMLLEVQKKLLDSLLAAERNEEKYVLLRDRALLEEYHKADQTFREQMNTAAGLSINPDLEKILATIGNLYDEYSRIFKQELEFINMKVEYKADEFKEKKEALISRLLAMLNEFKYLSREHMVDTLKAIDTQEEKAEKMLTLITLFAISFGILLSVIITRSIVKPLSSIRKKTLEISKGNLESNLQIHSPPEIATLSDAFNKMCDRLRELDNLKADFFSTMSHELRTPLTAIREGSSLLMESLGERITGRQKRMLEIISEESIRLINLVNNLLDLSKMEAGMLTYNLSDTDITLLIRQALNEAEPLLEARKINVREDISSVDVIKCDQDRLLQVIRNLISNAIKFTPTGGEITISTVRSGGHLLFSVEDQGPGIPEEYRERIFDKYQQASLPEVNLYKGTGLGLAIVKKVIEAHGGKVWVEPAEAGGSRFCFSLPC
ncbi:MAG: sensor histidine kinase [Nitrospirae bacterium]|nr:MAG: sensor histidine kinase [Nitrospirota bacterium]